MGDSLYNYAGNPGQYCDGASMDRPLEPAAARSEDPTRELRERIATLEDSALYITDLAICLPEHADWLWCIVDRLTAEAAALKGRLREQSSAAVPMGSNDSR